MIFKFKTMLLATVLGALAFTSCREQDSVTGDDGNVKYVIEIEGAGQTKGTVVSVGLDLADLKYDKEKEVTAILKQNDGTGWKPVTSENVSFTWSTTSSAFSGSPENEKCIISAVSEGSGKMHISASLDGDEVAAADVPVSVGDHRVLTWRNVTTSITGGTTYSAVLYSNYSVTVTVSSDNNYFGVGTSSSGLSSSVVAEFSTDTTKTISYMYTGSDETTVLLRTSPTAESTPVLTVKQTTATLDSITIEEANDNIILFNGESVDLHATGHYSDGTTDNISDKVTWIKVGAYGTSTLTANGNYATFTAGTPNVSDHTSGYVFCQFVPTGKSPLQSNHCPIKIDAPSGVSFDELNTNLPTGKSKSISVKKTYHYSFPVSVPASSLSLDASGSTHFTVSGNTLTARDYSTAWAGILGIGAVTVHASFSEHGVTISEDTTYTFQRYKYVTSVDGQGTLDNTFYLTVHYHDGTTGTTTDYQWQKQSESSWNDGPLVPTEKATYQFKYTDIIVEAVSGTLSWSTSFYN